MVDISAPVGWRAHGARRPGARRGRADELSDAGDSVRAALAALTPTVRDIASELGVSYASVHAWATCRRRPRVEHVERIAAIMERRALELGTLARRLKAEARARARRNG